MTAISRRQLLRTGASVTAATAAATLAAPVRPARANHELPDEPHVNLPSANLGAQMFATGKVEGGWGPTFEAIAAIGYRTVEFAGINADEIPEIKTELAANGLRGVGNHGGMDDASLEAAIALELPATGEAIGIPTYGTTVSGWEQKAAEWEAYGARCAAEGIRFYTHLHGPEFYPCSDDPTRRGFEVALAASEHWHIELDIWWAYVFQNYSGAPGLQYEPIDIVLNNPDRVRMFHVKDGKSTPTGNHEHALDQATVGNGDIPFRSFFCQLPDPLDTYDFIWESDTAGDHPHGRMGAAHASYLMMRYGGLACREDLPASAPDASVAPTTPAPADVEAQATLPATGSPGFLAGAAVGALGAAAWLRPPRFQEPDARGGNH